MLYYALPGQPEQQVTVVTEPSGPLRGQRVVCGREHDCLRYYQERQPVSRAA